MIEDWISAIAGILGECVNHGGQELFGRCVYCSCGRRLYQGIPMTDEEISAIKEAIKIDIPPRL